MRVTQLENYLAPGKIERSLALSRLVDLVTIVDQPVGDRFGGRLDISGLEIWPARTWRFTRLKSHPAGFIEDFPIHCPLNLPFLIWRSKPEIIFSRELGLRTLVALIMGRLLRCPVVARTSMSERTESGRGRLRLSLRRFLVRHADYLTYNGESCRRVLLDLDAPASRLRRLPTTASGTLREGDERNRGAAECRRLLLVGALVKRKGTLPFLESLRDWAVRRSDLRIEVSVVGEGPERDAIQSLDLPPNLHLGMVGFVEHQEMDRLYSEHGVLVLPTLSDEWGLVVNEALSAGLLVLGSRHSQAASELIREGKDGWLFTPGQMEEISRKLDQIFDTPEAELDRMRRQINPKLHDHHPLKIVETWLEICQAALPEYRKSRA